MVILGLSVILAPCVTAWTDPAGATPRYWLAIVAIVFLAVSTQVTAAGRLAYLTRALSDDRRTRAQRGARTVGLTILAATSCLEFMLMAALVKYDEWPLELAVATSAVAGALANGAALHWLSPLGRMTPMRAAVFAGGSVLLQLGGMVVLGSLPMLTYQAAWWLVRAGVLPAWIQPLFVQSCAAAPHVPADVSSSVPT
jgi:hypothetical protein